MSSNTISKTTLNDKKNKYPNYGIFSDTIGCVFETYHLDYLSIYSIFYNNYFSSIQYGQSAYINIHKSQLHVVVATPTFIPNTYPVK